MKALLQKLLEVAVVTILLLLVPLELLAQEEETWPPSSWGLAFSQDLQEPQKTQTDEQQTAEVDYEPQSGCWTSPESDKDVRVVEQSVTAGRLIHKVQPKYPKAARKAHVEGTVVFLRLSPISRTLRAFATITSCPSSLSKRLIQGECVPISSAIRLRGSAPKTSRNAFAFVRNRCSRCICRLHPARSTSCCDLPDPIQW